MDTYYDHHPLFIPAKPIALIGFPGAEVPRIAGSMSMTTGLPLIELERWIEHEAGKSIPQLVLEDGGVSIRELQSRMLLRALESRPPGVIALGHRCMQLPEDRDLVLQRSHCFYIQRTIFELFQALRREVEEFPARYAEFILGPPESVHDIKAMFDARDSEFRSAPHAVDAAGKSHTSLGREILELVQTLGPD